jgi:hypothetical protein
MHKWLLWTAYRQPLGTSTAAVMCEFVRSPCSKTHSLHRCNQGRCSHRWHQTWPLKQPTLCCITSQCSEGHRLQEHVLSVVDCPGTASSGCPISECGILQRPWRNICVPRVLHHRYSSSIKVQKKLDRLPQRRFGSFEKEFRRGRDPLDYRNSRISSFLRARHPCQSQAYLWRAHIEQHRLRCGTNRIPLH